MTLSPRRDSNGHELAMTEIQTVLREAEIGAEKTSALIRIVVFASLAAATFSVDRTHNLATSSEVAIAVYGIFTAAGLILAWRRIFRPWIPYLFVTSDVILISAQILMHSRFMGMGPAFAFAFPITGLIFVILIHASMRYRPWLILYAAGLFLASIHIGVFYLTDEFSWSPGETEMMARETTMHLEGMVTVMNYEVLPITLVALSALILFIISRGTRRLLVRSIRQTDHITKLSRFFSPNLANRLAEGEDEQLLAGRRQAAAVLFIDMRDFTTLGEHMAPDELGAFLTEYRVRLTQPIFKHGGTVDKFIGDAIMAVFGTPVQHPDDARRAIVCALDVVDATARWSLERVQSQKPSVAIGIGVHFGEVFAGALGNEQLLEYTVIGDTVNVAERLERLSREVESPLVVSAAVLGAVPDADRIAEWRRLPSKHLKGHRRPVEAFCLVARRADTGSPAGTTSS